MSRVTTGLLVGAALVMIAMYLSERSQRVATAPARTVDGWEAINSAGISFGAPSAPIQVTAFMDFTCPYSQGLWSTLDSIMSMGYEDVSVVWKYFPLADRPGARAAARVAECSREQGLFLEVIRQLMDSDVAHDAVDLDSLAPALIGSPVDFEACLSRPDEGFTRISEDRFQGLSAGVYGTPTVWINGAFFAGRSPEDFEDAFRTLRIRR